MKDEELLKRYSITDTLNNDFYSSLGIARGKMRAIIFFFHCARSSGDNAYEEIAGLLMDELFEQLYAEMPIDFANGLSGIGWGIEYLIQQGFIEGNADEILEEIDLYVVRAIYLQEMNDLGLDRGVLGLGRYILMRIRSHWKTGDTYSSLELKENLIYLIDWLGQRLDEMGDETGELLEWLLELRETGFYKVKVEKMVSKINKNTYENAEQITVINTTRIDGSEARYKQKMEMFQDFYPSPFMGNYFCEIAHCNAAFVAISKNAVTYLKNIAIYTNTGVITTSKDEIHDRIGYTPENGYLHPIGPDSENWGKDIVKFAIWRDPVERLVSCYKHFCLEGYQRCYYTYLGLCRESSFDRFMEFVRFELGKNNPLYQDEHIRRQSDYYNSEDVDYIVSIEKIDAFLQEYDIPLIKENTNPSHAKFALIDTDYIAEIKELYKSDYQILPNY